MKLFYRVDEVARLLDVSPRTVYRMVEAGTLPNVSFRGCIRIPAREFLAKFQIQEDSETVPRLPRSLTH